MSRYTAEVQAMHLCLYGDKTNSEGHSNGLQMISYKPLMPAVCCISKCYSLIWKAIMCFKWMNYSVPEPPGLTSLFKCAWPAISFQSKTKGAELPGEQRTVGSGGMGDVRSLFSWPTWINPIRHWVVLEDATPHVNRSFITQVSWCLNEWVSGWMKTFTSEGTNVSDIHL